MSIYDKTMDGVESEKVSDFEYHTNIMSYHKSFMDHAEAVRKKANLGKETLSSTADSLAKRAFLLKYKGIYVVPDMVVPERVKRLIDARNK